MNTVPSLVTDPELSGASSMFGLDNRDEQPRTARPPEPSDVTKGNALLQSSVRQIFFRVLREISL